MIIINTRKKMQLVITAVLMLCALLPAAWAAGDYGAAAVKEDQTYSLEQMLNYAIEDEYLAQARYRADIEKFGEIRPFTSIVKAEKRHIGLLRPLFDKYGVAVPDDKAASYLTEPETLLDAMKAGVAGEEDNIRMYDIFLKHELPNDARVIFSLLKNAAENHLEAFKRNVALLEQGGAGRAR